MVGTLVFFVENGRDPCFLRRKWSGPLFSLWKMAGTLVFFVENGRDRCFLRGKWRGPLFSSWKMVGVSVLVFFWQKRPRFVVGRIWDVKKLCTTGHTLLYCPAVFGHFLDPPGNHPRGAIFPTVDWINQSSVDFHCKPFGWLIDWLTIS